MSLKINAKIRRVAESTTLAMTARAKAMKAQGINVIGFAAGEPDFDTPEVVRKRAIADIESGVTRYTESSGTLELRKTICAKLKRENNLDYAPEQVIVSCGGKHTLYNIFETMLEAGDEVIVPIPYWLTYPEQIHMAGGECIYIPTSAESNYKITPAQLDKAITKKTLAFLFNSPSNPSGMVYTPDEIRALAAVLERHPHVAVISDEIYERLLYGGMTHLSFAAASPAMKERTLTVNSMSKTYAMTGWRIGYCAGASDFVQAMGRMQSHSTSNPTTFCQSASIAALNEAEADVEKMRRSFDERRKDMLARVRAIPGVRCPEPLGAFYVFADVGDLYPTAKVRGSMEFCDRLLNEAQVVCVPGEPFGDDRSIRLSYAIAPKAIAEGLDRIAAFVKKLG